MNDSIPDEQRRKYDASSLRCPTLLGTKYVRDTSRNKGCGRPVLIIPYESSF